MPESKDEHIEEQAISIVAPASAARDANNRPEPTSAAWAVALAAACVGFGIALASAIVISMLILTVFGFSLPMVLTTSLGAACSLVAMGVGLARLLVVTSRPSLPNSGDRERSTPPAGGSFGRTQRISRRWRTGMKRVRRDSQ